MNTQALRDRNLRLLAHIDTRSNGMQYLRGPLNQPLGHYDPKTNQTYDQHHRLVGYGNLLNTLLSR